MTATQGPCEAWDPIWCCTLTGAHIPVTGTAAQIATEVLHHLSGQRFGVCSFTVRPCIHECWSGGGWPGMGSWWQWPGGGMLYPQPFLYDGTWTNLTCGRCGDRCSCTELCEAWLPGPINSITQVKLDGAVLVSGTDYRVDDFRKLIRLGGGCWPTCQDMTLADTQDNTWSVTFRVGEEVPMLGRLAVGELACEILPCLLGGGTGCRLPANATRVDRQGITIDLELFTAFLKDGMLGLRWADVFLKTFNPQGLRARPRVYDVDGGPGFRTVGT